ncbi:unnamed protein product [Schistocephalus solidus]|uniref:TraB domain-containing protein n=1 Tax=Schistocephalus solidus TaxID=70667 RepID=A0A183T6X8_SCHSO|nr:unnamed protein product [Schistocephalus solidus]
MSFEPFDENPSPDAENSDGENVQEYISSSVRFFEDVKKVRKSPFALPETVTLIECENGTKVYIVGTAHFSSESIQDVNYVIDHTLPDFVLVELCRGRGHSMMMDEDEIRKQIKENSIFSFVKTLGVSHGLLQYLLLRFTSCIMDQIGMAPGGEFRAAFKRAAQQPHCHLILGDRPITVTLSRTLDAFSLWQKIRLFCALLFNFESISKEEIEAMKKHDLLEELLKNMAGSFPELSRVILKERDLFLARSIWEVCGFPQTTLAPSSTSNGGEDEDERSVVHRRQPQQPPPASCPATDASGDVQEEESGDAVDASGKIRCCPEWPTLAQLPRVVVAVVGIGHVAGIRAALPRAATISKAELLEYVNLARSQDLILHPFL